MGASSDKAGGWLQSLTDDPADEDSQRPTGTEGTARTAIEW